MRDLVEDASVDLADELKMARRQAAEQPDIPALQGIGHQRMVGVGEHRSDDVLGRVPVEAVLVEQEPHQLGDRDHRMGVVEMDGRALRQLL